jgi:hypothetical protein
VPGVRYAPPGADLGAVPAGEARGAGEVGGCCSGQAREDETPELGRLSGETRSVVVVARIPVRALSCPDACPNVCSCGRMPPGGLPLEGAGGLVVAKPGSVRGGVAVGAAAMSAGEHIRLLAIMNRPSDEPPASASAVGEGVVIVWRNACLDSMGATHPALSLSSLGHEAAHLKRRAIQSPTDAQWEAAVRADAGSDGPLSSSSLLPGIAANYDHADWLDEDLATTVGLVLEAEQRDSLPEVTEKSPNRVRVASDFIA